VSPGPRQTSRPSLATCHPSPYGSPYDDAPPARCAPDGRGAVL
jgi:hypothetical protein